MGKAVERRKWYQGGGSSQILGSFPGPVLRPGLAEIGSSS